MIELCRLELASITTAINENKVSRYKDTVENWSPVTQIVRYSVCLCTFTRQCNQAQTASKKTWCLKGLAPADLFKKKICINFYCFLCDYYVALISALVQLKCNNLRITVVV